MVRARGPGGRFIRTIATRKYGLGSGIGGVVGPVLRQAMRYAKSYTATRTKSKSKSESRPGWHDSSTYDGRFIKRRGSIRKRTIRRGAPYKRKSRRRSSAVKGENYYATYGATSTFETIGATADPDVLYIGHTAHIGYESLLLMCCALLRNLYKVACGYETLDLNETLPANDCSITMVWVNEQTGVSFSAVKVVPSGATLWSLAASDEILGNFARYSENGTLYQDVKFQWINMQETGVSQRVMGRVDLLHATVDMYAKSELKIQNRTTSNSTDNEVTDVNAVPLVGRQYSLPGCAPEVVGAGQQISIWDQLTGMTLCRSADINMNTGMKEPPPSKVFRGCTNSSKVRLEPGAIKSDWMVKRVTLPLHRFLIKLGFNADTSSSNLKSTLSGSSLIALEKVIAVSGAPNISLQYECNFWQGVVVKHRRLRPALSRVTGGVKNNVPA